MLADHPIVVESGRLEPEIHLPRTATYMLIEFIAGELPRWRDDPDRKPESSEVRLTDQLCSHLNNAARVSNGWSRIQFRTEVPDEVRGARTIDLAAKPSGAILLIAGHRYTKYDSLFPIECKRLPTPKERDRDEREYVATSHGTRGGIQRFKLAQHGAAHKFAAMIAYVQEMTFSDWVRKINGWIKGLSTEAAPVWMHSETLSVLQEDSIKGVCTLRSDHQRKGNLGQCELRHLWIKMN